MSQQGNIGQAIITAREKGEVHFSDIQEGIDKYFSFPWCGAAGYNTGSNKARALNYDTTMRSTSGTTGIRRAREQAQPKGTAVFSAGRPGRNGDIVYKFALKGEEDNGEMEQ